MTDAVAGARDNQALIDELWDFDDPQASEGRFRAAAAQAAEVADGNRKTILQTQLARALGLAAGYEDAAALLEALPPDADTELKVRVLLERGRVLNSSGDPAAARPLFEAAFEAARAAGFENLAVDALHMIAIVAPPDEQETLNRHALELAAGGDDPRARRWRASLLNNLGWTVFERGEYEAALALFEEALAERVARGKLAEVQVAQWSIGRTLRALGRLEEALTVQRALAREHADGGTSDPYVDDEIAACLAELGQSTRAG